MTLILSMHAVASSAPDQQGQHHIPTQQQHGARVQRWHCQRWQPQPKGQPRAACDLRRSPLQRRLPQPAAACEGMVSCVEDWFQCHLLCFCGRAWVIMSDLLARLCHKFRLAPWLQLSRGSHRPPKICVAMAQGSRALRRQAKAANSPQQLRAAILDLTQLRRRIGLHCRSQVLSGDCAKRVCLVNSVTL